MLADFSIVELNFLFTAAIVDDGTIDIQTPVPGVCISMMELWHSMDRLDLTAQGVALQCTLYSLKLALTSAV